MKVRGIEHIRKAELMSHNLLVSIPHFSDKIIPSGHV